MSIQHKLQETPLNNWSDAREVLEAVHLVLVNLPDRVPSGLSPRAFRRQLRLASFAVCRAIGLAESRVVADILKERRGAAAALRAQGKPELPALLPARLRPDAKKAGARGFFIEEV